MNTGYDTPGLISRFLLPRVLRRGPGNKFNDTHTLVSLWHATLGFY